MLTCNYKDSTFSSVMCVDSARGSNSGPPAQQSGAPAQQSGALPTELIRRKLFSLVYLCHLRCLRLIVEGSNGNASLQFISVQTITSVMPLKEQRRTEETLLLSGIFQGSNEA